MEYPGLREEFRLVSDAIARINRNYLYPEIEGPTDVAWLVGACFLGQTETLLAAGGFNDVFFLYSEDIDLCKRLTALGHRVLTVPDAECVHVGSVSTSAAFSEDARVKRRADARNLFYRLWYRRPTRVLIHLRRAIGIKHQPFRIKYHIGKMFRDGGSLAEDRFPSPLRGRE
jgi:GT2 family glycosyltransferase